MLYFTDIANWFDKNRVETDRILDKWVEDSNYNQGIMLVAATTHALTTFGAGFVDLLRLGDGVREGGLSGWGGACRSATGVQWARLMISLHTPRQWFLLAVNRSSAMLI